MKHPIHYGKLPAFAEAFVAEEANTGCNVFMPVVKLADMDETPVAWMVAGDFSDFEHRVTFCVVARNKRSKAIVVEYNPLTNETVTHRHYNSNIMPNGVSDVFDTDMMSIDFYKALPGYTEAMSLIPGAAMVEEA